MYKDFWIGKLGISLYWYDEVCDVKWMYVYDGGVEFVIGKLGINLYW